jgi:hypothetical protein
MFGLRPWPRRRNDRERSAFVQALRAAATAGRSGRDGEGSGAWNSMAKGRPRVTGRHCIRVQRLFGREFCLATVAVDLFGRMVQVQTEEHTARIDTRVDFLRAGHFEVEQVLVEPRVPGSDLDDQITASMQVVSVDERHVEQLP